MKNFFLHFLHCSFLFLVAMTQPVWGHITASATDLKALNDTVGGRLYHGTPFAQPCFNFTSLFSGSSSTTSEECSTIQSRYFDHTFRSDHFGAYQISQWETCETTSSSEGEQGSQCLLDATNPANETAYSPPRLCGQGSVPDYYIDVRGPEDVKAAFRFSLRTKVPLVIKNTGHDYIGRSSGSGTLALWTHNLQSIAVDRNFTAEGCSSSESSSHEGQTALTIGAGQRFQSIYNFAKDHNLTVVGGADVSVGAAGGWVQGGGHSALSVSHGLGVDRVLQFKVVTPDGVYRTANECQNQDLYFALRGGGGGTFGVVLETSFSALPQMTVQVALGLYVPFRNNSYTVLKGLAKTAVPFAKDGWGGYITPILGAGLWVNTVLNGTEAESSTANVQSIYESVGGSFSLFPMESFTDFYNYLIAPTPDPVGVPQALASRLIPDTAFDDEDLVKALIDAVLDSELGQILAVGPYAYKGHKLGSTATHPAWRKTVWHALGINFWNYDASPAERIAKYKDIQAKWAPVIDRTPGSGAYFNEADVYEASWQNAFWGDNYPKLLTIKRKYDPHHLLDCWKCVGWKGTSDPRYKCYPDITAM